MLDGTAAILDDCNDGLGAYRNYLVHKIRDRVFLLQHESDFYKKKFQVEVVSNEEGKLEWSGLPEPF